MVDSFGSLFDCTTVGRSKGLFNLFLVVGVWLSLYVVGLIVVLFVVFLFWLQIAIKPFTDLSLIDKFESFSDKWNFGDLFQQSMKRQNIDCGYSLEPPRQGGVTSAHNLCF